VTLRKAQVIFKEQQAGTLDETADGGTRFTYAPNWGEPIACCLPPTQREHEWRQGVHPFFQHLAPEGWLREQQARVAHIAEEDDFGLLLRYGADCIGAVGVKRADDAAAEDDAPITEATANPGRTVSGIQRKLLVIKQANGAFAPAAADGLAPYSAKFNSERLDTLVRNEALSLRWSAAILGKGELNDFTLGTVATIDEPALVVTRFDRLADGGKLRLEDFAQILCKPRGRDFAGKYEAAYEDVAAVIRDHSVRPEIDQARFFRRLVLFVLVGNCDGHLKNFSLLETDAGLRLSPAYDIVNTAIYDGFDQQLALSIDGRKPNLDEVTKAKLVAFGLSIGLSQRTVDQIFSDLASRVKRASSILQPPQGEPPEGFVHRYSEIVSRACLRIFGA
jgi:serine/threonine-protein kinase HipA